MRASYTATMRGLVFLVLVAGAGCFSPSPPGGPAVRRRAVPGRPDLRPRRVRVTTGDGRRSDGDDDAPSRRGRNRLHVQRRHPGVRRRTVGRLRARVLLGGQRALRGARAEQRGQSHAGQRHQRCDVRGGDRLDDRRRHRLDHRRRVHPHRRRGGSATASVTSGSTAHRALPISRSSRSPRSPSRRPRPSR